MITMLACDNCLMVIRVLGDAEVIDNLIIRHSKWTAGWPCVSENCHECMRRVTDTEEVSGIFAAADTSLIRVNELSPEDAFKALCGLGLPEEIGALPEVIRALLLSNKVKDIQNWQSASGRTVIDWLELENGVRIHLASSPAGPIVYKITRNRGT